MKSVSFKYLYFIFVFAITKSSIFFGPILLSEIINTEHYGLFEYTLALGGILAILFSSGVEASYSYFTLKRKKVHLKNLFYIHPFITSGILIIGILFYFFDIIGVKFLYSILIGYIISVQNFIATTLKAEEKPIYATILTSGIYLILILSVFFLFSSQSEKLDFFWLILSLYCLVLWALIIYRIKALDLSKISKIYPKVLKFGLPIIFSSVFVLIVTTSGRIFVEFFIGTYAVALYSFYFRLASIVIILYQTVAVYFYKQIYVLSHQKLDLYFGAFLLVILFAGGVSFFTVPLVGMDLLKLLNETFDQYEKVYLLFVFQMVFWVGVALNESVITRENLAKRISILFFFLCLLFTGVLFVYSKLVVLSLENFVLIHTVAMFTGTELQFFVLRRRRGIEFPKTRIVTFGCFILLLLVYAFY